MLHYNKPGFEQSREFGNGGEKTSSTVAPTGEISGSTQPCGHIQCEDQLGGNSLCGYANAQCVRFEKIGDNSKLQNRRNQMQTTNDDDQCISRSLLSSTPFVGNQLSYVDGNNVSNSTLSKPQTKAEKLYQELLLVPINTCKYCNRLYQKTCICLIHQCLCGRYSSKKICRVCSNVFTIQPDPNRVKLLDEHYETTKILYFSNQRLNNSKVKKTPKPIINKTKLSKEQKLGKKAVELKFRLRLQEELTLNPNASIYWRVNGKYMYQIDTVIQLAYEGNYVEWMMGLRGGMMNPEIQDEVLQEIPETVLNEIVDEELNLSTTLLEPELSEQEIKGILNKEELEEIRDESLQEFQEKLNNVRKVKSEKKQAGTFNIRLGPKSEKKIEAIKQSTSYEPVSSVDLSKVTVRSTNPPPLLFTGPKSLAPKGSILDENNTEPTFFYEAQLLAYAYTFQNRKVNLDNYIQNPMVEVTSILTHHNILTPPRNSLNAMVIWYPDHTVDDKDYLWETIDGTVYLKLRRGKTTLSYSFAGLYVEATSKVFRSLRMYVIRDITIHDLQEVIDQTMDIEYQNKTYHVSRYLYAFLTTLNPNLMQYTLRANVSTIRKHFESSVINTSGEEFVNTVAALTGFWHQQISGLQSQTVTNNLPTLQNEKLAHDMLNNPGSTTLWSLLDSVAKFFLPSYAYQFVHGYLNSLSHISIKDKIKDFFDTIKSFFGFGPKMYAFRYINETTSIILEEIIKTIPGGSLPIIALDLINLKRDGNLTWYNALKTVLFHGWSDLLPISAFRVILLPFRVFFHVWHNIRSETKEWSGYQMDQINNENRKSELTQCSRQIMKIHATMHMYEEVEKEIRTIAKEQDTPKATEFFNHPGFVLLKQRAIAVSDAPLRDIKRSVSHLYYCHEGTYYFADDDRNRLVGCAKRCYMPQPPIDKDVIDLALRVYDKIDEKFQENRTLIDCKAYIQTHVQRALYETHFNKTDKLTPDELKYRNTLKNKSNEKSGKDADRVYWAAEVAVACRVGAVLEPYQWFLKEILFNGKTDLNEYLELNLDYSVYILYAARHSDEVGEFLFRAQYDTQNLYVAILGDDSLGQQYTIKIGNDMSRFDSTIRKELLDRFKAMIAKRTYVHEDHYLTIFEKQWDAPFGFDTEEGWKQLPKPNGLPTGCAWTGVSNTTNMGISFIVNALLGRNVTTSPQTQKELGWLSKPNIYKGNSYPEFLKRIWVPYAQTCYPVPILSMFLKALGSCEEKVENLVPKGRLRNDYGNINAFNYGILNSMLNTKDIPYFDALKEHYYSQTSFLSRDFEIIDKDSSYKLGVGRKTKPPLPDELVHEAYTQRYNSTHFDHNLTLQLLKFTPCQMYTRFGTPFTRSVMSMDYGYTFFDA